MKLFLVYRPTVLASVSPNRLLEEHGQEIAWANAFLDAQRIRQLSLRSLRAYAYDLLHFARWWSQPPLPVPLSEIDEASLVDYVRSQLDQEPPPAPATVNRRLTVIHCLYRFHYGREISPGQTHFQRPLYLAVPARLRQAAPRRGPRIAIKTAPARRRPPLRRTGRPVLAQLSYLPRPRRGGLDAARWPAFL